MCEQPEMVTYSPPPGGTWGLDYAFVTELEWFEGDADPTRMRRQRWVCVEDEVGTYHPPTALGEQCDQCDGLGYMEFNGPDCGKCNGEGWLPARLRDVFVPDPSVPLTEGGEG